MRAKKDGPRDLTGRAIRLLFNLDPQHSWHIDVFDDGVDGLGVSAFQSVPIPRVWEVDIRS